MLGLDQHEGAARRERGDDRVGDLRREPLLHLRPLRVAVDEARDLREAGDAAVVAGDVRDVGAAVEREEMVLAVRVQRDVAHHDHLVVIGFEGDREVAGGILVQAARDLAVHLRDARRCAREPVAIGVFTDGEQQLADRLLDPGDVDAGALGIS